MPTKKSSKKHKKSTTEHSNKILIYKSEMQQYGKIDKLLGEMRVNVILPDNTEILGVIQGKFRKRVWFKSGDVVLVSRRDFQENKVDIIHKYSENDIKKLVREYEIPSYFQDGIEEINDAGIIITDDEEDNNEIDLDEI